MQINAFYSSYHIFMNKNKHFGFVIQWLFALVFAFFAANHLVGFFHKSPVETSALFKINPFFLLFAVVLLMVNLSLEAWKWQTITQTIESLSFKKAFLSVLSGMGVSFMLPNRVGQFIGRVAHLQDHNRMMGSALSLASNFLQLVTITILGCVALLDLRLLVRIPSFNIFDLLVIMVVATGVGTGVAYFFRKKLSLIINAFSLISLRIWVKIAIIGLLRTFVYGLQYVMIFFAYNGVTSIWLVFKSVLAINFVQSILPSVFITEPLIRSSVGNIIFENISNNAQALLLAPFVNWILGLLLPSIAGAIILIKLKKS
jgi:uncharacterized membrane protein YbhN (UPF0104 family)